MHTTTDWHVWQFKKFDLIIFKNNDFIVFTSCKLNIEFDGSIFVNACYSVLLTKLIVTRRLQYGGPFSLIAETCTCSVQSLQWCAFPYSWMDYVDRFSIVSSPFEGVRVPVAYFHMCLMARRRSFNTPKASSVSK